MENGQMPTVQPAQPTPGVTSNTISSVPGAQRAGVEQKKKRDVAGIVKTIVIIFLSLLAMTFIGLFIWMTMQYNDAHNLEQAEIDAAVARAVERNSSELEEEFLEREKDPNRDFAGPVDYGQLSFKYPKTWSVYIAKDAVSGGDFEAYFNPIEVEAISKETINALRLTIRDKAFEDVALEYQKAMDKKDSNLAMESITVNGFAANRYVGNIPGTERNGIIVIFKIRDKTAVLQTDAMLFENDFNNLVSTITFNE